MWITIASILAAFTVSKAKDENGKDIEIEGDYCDSGLITLVSFLLCSFRCLNANTIRHKNPFKCSILPRSDTAKRLVQEAKLN